MQKEGLGGAFVSFTFVTGGNGGDGSVILGWLIIKSIFMSSKDDTEFCLDLDENLNATWQHSHALFDVYNFHQFQFYDLLDPQKRKRIIARLGQSLIASLNVASTYWIAAGAIPQFDLWHDRNLNQNKTYLN